VLALTNFCENACFFTLLFEAADSGIESLTFADFDDWHLKNHPISFEESGFRVWHRRPEGVNTGFWATETPKRQLSICKYLAFAATYGEDRHATRWDCRP